MQGESCWSVSRIDGGTESGEDFGTRQGDASARFTELLNQGKIVRLMHRPPGEATPREEDSVPRRVLRAMQGAAPDRQEIDRGQTAEDLSGLGMTDEQLRYVFAKLTDSAEIEAADTSGSRFRLTNLGRAASTS